MSKKRSIAYFANPTSIHTCKWINHFVKKNNIILFCHEEVGADLPLLSDKVKVFSILPRYSVLNFKSRISTIKKLKQISLQEDIEIIHSMYAVPNAIWADEIANQNHIITTRGSDVLIDYSQTYFQPKNLVQYFSYPVMRKKIVKAFENAVSITCTSMKQIQVVDDMLEGKQAQLIRTGVDSNKFGSSKKKIEGAVRIFSPRSMRPLYNIDLIIDAVSILRQTSSEEFRLTIIDDSPGSDYSNSIHDLIQKNKLSEIVEVLPAINQAEMIKQYHLNDLVIMIPSSDGTPNSAIEAMLAKRPVIMGPLEYDPDLFNENTVWQVEDFSPNTLATSIREVLSKKNEKLDAAFGTAIENASLEMSIKKITSLYSEI